MINDKLAQLKEKDLYSLALFALYKLIDIPEYSSLSELSYVLDHENLFSLCDFFGGQTIKIPTLDELETLIYALLLFMLTKVYKEELSEAETFLLDHGCKNLHAVKSQYKKLIGVIREYDFQPNREF